MLQHDTINLLQWYHHNQRQLPWRETLDGYAVMVSEFMLQQTTVAAVEPKFLEWMERFPDFDSLASAEESAVFSQWSGLGYYQRARRLHQAAREVARRGYLPDSFEELLTLPGVGPYTAAAVSSICFGRPALAVDTNVIRVLFRYYAFEKPAQHKASQDELRRRLAPSLNANDPGQLNQALMELGATICSVKEPGCLICPLAKGCRGRTHPGGPTNFPTPTKKKKPKQTRGKALILSDNEENSVLLVQGTSLGLLSPLYQPPILFSPQESEERYSRAFTRLVSRLPEESTTAPQVKYGISGRKLILDCLVWRMEAPQLNNLRVQLQEDGLSVKRYHPEKEQLPVSSLTRKILQKCLESR